MNNEKVAGVYAKALFEILRTEADKKNANEGMKALLSFFNNERKLAQCFSSLQFSSDEKIKVWKAVSAGTELPKEVIRLIELLLERGRFELLEVVVGVYSKILNESLGVVDGCLLSAEQVDAETVATLSRLLSSKLKKQVQLASEVREDLLGGIVIKVGSKIYDGSLKSGLQKMKDSLERCSV